EQVGKGDVGSWGWSAPSTLLPVGSAAVSGPFCLLPWSPVDPAVAAQDAHMVTGWLVLPLSPYATTLMQGAVVSAGRVTVAFGSSTLPNTFCGSATSRQVQPAASSPGCAQLQVNCRPSRVQLPSLGGATGRCRITRESV